MKPGSQRFFVHSCIYLRILIISYLATFLGTNSFSVLMCRKAVNQSIKAIIQTRSACTEVLVCLQLTAIFHTQLDMRDGHEHDLILTLSLAYTFAYIFIVYSR